MAVLVLAGIRVLDVGRYIAGPFCAALLRADRRRSLDPRLARFHHPHRNTAQLRLRRYIQPTRIPTAHRDQSPPAEINDTYSTAWLVKSVINQRIQPLRKRSFATVSGTTPIRQTG